MMAVILAGGKGTRLHPYTAVVPKPLLPLGDMPILRVVVRQLAAAGFRRIVITLGHMAHLFTEALGTGENWGTRVEYCLEAEPLGTAGSLRLIHDPDESFLVMNGDLLTTVDIGELFRVHRERGAWGTIATSRRTVHIDYGVVETAPDGSLRHFLEKPVIPYSVSMGVNVLSRRALEFIPASGPFDMPELILALLRAGKPVVCHPTDCYWQDIGRVEDYRQASEDFLADPGRFLPGLRRSP